MKSIRETTRDPTGKFLDYAKANVWLLVAALILFAGFYLTIQSWLAANHFAGPGVGIVAAAEDSRLRELEENKPVDSEAYKVPADHPRYFSSSDLGISNARIIPVGLTPENNLDAPENIYDVGWYANGSFPGKPGEAAVLDGHITGFTKPGVFEHLSYMQLGQRISIEMGDGTKLNYKVVDKQRINYKHFDMVESLKSRDKDKHGLTIITCGGEYDAEADNYLSRDIVYAVLD